MTTQSGYEKRPRTLNHLYGFSIDGYEAMHLIRKGQIRWLPKGDVSGIAGSFTLASASLHNFTLNTAGLSPPEVAGTAAVRNGTDPRLSASR